jgi:hypothetical protein
MPTPNGAPPPLPAPGIPAGPPPALDEGAAPVANAFGVDHVACPTDCCKIPCFYADFEYLLWWFKSRRLPTLLTQGDPADTIPAALGQPHTSILFGGGNDINPFSGGRLSLGYWCDTHHTFGIEANGFLFEARVAHQTFGSDAGPNSLVIARPFFDSNFGIENSDPVAVPFVQAGTISFVQPRRFFGGEANVRWSQDESLYKRSRLSFLLGGRYLNLYEELDISEHLTDIPGQGVPGNVTDMGEQFVAFNQFYGGQIGVGWEARLADFFLDIDARVALGTNRQVQKLSGFTTITEPDGTVTTGVNRALFVQPSNAGRTSDMRFSQVYQTTVHLGYNFNDYVRLTIGYDFLWWHAVARSGEGLDRTTSIPALPNTTFVPGTNPGQPDNRNGNFWAQGLSLGLGFSF